MERQAGLMEKRRALVRIEELKEALNAMHAVEDLFDSDLDEELSPRFDIVIEHMKRQIAKFEEIVKYEL